MKRYIKPQIEILNTNLSEVGLSERSVMYALVGLASDNIIKKVKRGEYEKLQ